MPLRAWVLHLILESKLVHGLLPHLPTSLFTSIYFVIWSLPALFLPLIIAATDDDAARTRRFLILYVLVWVGLGNIVALIGMSVGPVYFDRLEGSVRFAGLAHALIQSGVEHGPLGKIQDSLWNAYANRAQVVGSGISAFPSVHVAVATLTMLYLGERSRWLAPFGMAFLVAILFLAVYVGWHYAIDGYFSIFVMVSAWSYLRERNVVFALHQPA